MLQEMWEDGWIGRTMLALFLSMIAIIFWAVATVAYGVWLDTAHPCTKSHRELIHYPAWTQFILAGKVLVPIVHEEHDVMEDVCDERE